MFSCKKDTFSENVNGYKEETLSSEFMGDWRWVSSGGGFAGIEVFRDTASKNILTMASNKTYKWCKSDTCSSGKWFFGSKDKQTLLFFEAPKNKTNFPLTIEQIVPIRIVDTMILRDDCNDCFSNKFVRVKK